MPIAHNLRRKTMFTAALMLALPLVLAITSTTGANTHPQHVARATAPPKPDYSYFSGKTVTWITTKVGGSNDLFARALAPLLGSYLHCTVNVENISSGPVAAEADAAAAPPNGLSIGTLQINSDLDDDIENISGNVFSIQKQVALAAVLGGDGLIGVQPNFPVKSFKELVASRSAVTFTDETPGGTDLEARLLFFSYGVKARFITGYNSNQLVANGYLRGDAPGVVDGATALIPYVVNNLVRVLLQFGALPVGGYGYAQLHKALSVRELFAQNPPKSKLGTEAMKELLSIVSSPNMMIIAPQGTPKPIAQALIDALHAIMIRPSTKQALLSSGEDAITYVSPQAAEDAIRYDFNHEAVAKRVLGFG